MKTKKFSKKLLLKKETITNLSNKHLRIIKGGEISILAPCELSIQSNCLKCTGTCETCNTCPSAELKYACCVPDSVDTCIVDCTQLGTVCGSTPCC